MCCAPRGGDGLLGPVAEPPTHHAPLGFCLSCNIIIVIFYSDDINTH